MTCRGWQNPRRLARAVRPEEAEDRARGHRLLPEARWQRPGSAVPGADPPHMRPDGGSGSPDSEQHHRVGRTAGRRDCRGDAGAGAGPARLNGQRFCDDSRETSAPGIPPQSPWDTSARRRVMLWAWPDTSRSTGPHRAGNLPALRGPRELEIDRSEKREASPPRSSSCPCSSGRPQRRGVLRRQFSVISINTYMRIIRRT